MGMKAEVKALEDRMKAEVKANKALEDQWKAKDDQLKATEKENEKLKTLL